MIHPTAEVQTESIGEGTVIWQHCVVLAGAKIGRDCNVNCNVFIENDVVVGDGVTIKSGVQLWDGVTLEDRVFVGPSVAFTNDLRPRAFKRPGHFLRTLVKTGASIGANATIIGGRVIGEYAMIGAGGVVTRDVPAHTLWRGNPAVFAGYVCSCGGRLSEQMSCVGCGETYLMEQGVSQARIVRQCQVIKGD